MNPLLSVLAAAPLVLLTALPADADPCGMVLPIAVNDGGNFRIERIGLQKTYVFYHKKIESIVIRFAGVKTTLEIVFCFSCDELLVYKDGKRIGGEDFDDRRADLLAIMRRTFPDDETIQALTN